MRPFPVSALASLALAGCLRAWVFSQLPQPLLGNVEPTVPLGTLSAEGCAACHAEIAEEWRGSMMAMAWVDPVFQAEFHAQGELYACEYCHAPLGQQRATVATGLSSLRPVTATTVPNPEFSDPLRGEGVTCTACHLRDRAMVGPYADATAPHPFAADPAWLSGPLCESCHQVSAPPFSATTRDVADTHREHERWQAATGRTESCVDCHMPAVTRAAAAGAPVRAGRRHTFPGTWDDAFVRDGLRVGDARKVDGGIEVQIENLAGHDLPTAEPGRRVVVRVDLAEGGGVRKTREARIERRIDARTFREAGDTSLRGGETRLVRVPFTEADLAAARAATVTVSFDRLANFDVRVSGVGAREVLIAERTVGW